FILSGNQFQTIFNKYVVSLLNGSVAGVVRFIPFGNKNGGRTVCRRDYFPVKHIQKYNNLGQSAYTTLIIISIFAGRKHINKQNLWLLKKSKTQDFPLKFLTSKHLEPLSPTTCFCHGTKTDSGASLL